MLVTIDDVVSGQVFEPNAGSFVVAFQAFFVRTFEHRGVKVVGVEFQYIYQVFPGIVNGFFFKVVAKAPVAQHFEHGVVIGVVSHLFQVVVFTAHAQALLRVGASARFGIALTENNIFPLVHTSVGKHQSGVVLNNHRCRRHNGMTFRLKEFFV